MNCAICNYNSTSFFSFPIQQYLRGKSQWYYCSKCGAFFTSHAVSSEKTEQIGEPLYGKSETAILLSMYKKRLYKNVLKLLFKYKPKPFSVLDIGASFGGFCFLALKHPLTVYATDVLPEAVKFLNENGIHAETTATVSEMKIADEIKFDAVVALDSIYYWNNLKSEIHNIFERMNNNGIFIIRTSDKSWLLKIGLLLKKIFPPGNSLLSKSVHDHLCCIPIKTLKCILQESGFTILEISYTNAIPSDSTKLAVKCIYLLGDVLYKLFRVNLSAGYMLVCRKMF